MNVTLDIGLHITSLTTQPVSIHKYSNITKQGTYPEENKHHLKMIGHKTGTNL